METALKVYREVMIPRESISKFVTLIQNGQRCGRYWSIDEHPVSPHGYQLKAELPQLAFVNVTLCGIVGKNNILIDNSTDREKEVILKESSEIWIDKIRAEGRNIIPLGFKAKV